MSTLNEFDHGALMAVATLVRLHDQPGMAADVLINMGLSDADCSGLDEFDKMTLRRLQGERRTIKMKGLGRAKAN